MSEPTLPDSSTWLPAFTAWAQAVDVAAATNPPDPEPVTYRDPRDQPFISDTWWNHPLCDGLTYTTSSDARTKAVQDMGKGGVNSTDWSYPRYFSDGTEQYVDVIEYDNNGNQTGDTARIRLDPDAHPCGPNSTDKQVLSIQKDLIDYEMYKFSWTDESTVRTTRLERVPIAGDGRGPGAIASKTPAIGGLLTRKELAAGKIEHRLKMSGPDSLLKEGYVYPAQAEDANAETAYTGPVPMGALLAIPPSVDIESLALTPEGKALGHALQDFGGHILLRATTICLYLDAYDPDPDMAKKIKDAYTILYKYLVVVDGVTREQEGGPGAPRVPFPADLDPAIVVA